MQKLCYRILLVEDDADDRYIMHQAFHELSFDEEVKMFSSGDELLTYLSHLSPSVFPELIVLDYNMPAMNGAELGLALKKNPMFSTIPIALYSTGMRPKMQEELLQNGILCCFDKGMEYKDAVDLAQAFRNIISGTFQSSGMLETST